jgi:sugar/nucleoside kinase (ribokinase family)
LWCNHVPVDCRCLAWLDSIDILKPNCAEAAVIAAALREQRRTGELVSAGNVDRRSLCVVSPSVSNSACAPMVVKRNYSHMTSRAHRRLCVALPDVETILQAGVGSVLLSLGADGCALCHRKHGLFDHLRAALHVPAAVPAGGVPAPHTMAPAASSEQAVHVVYVPARPCTVVNVNGAGDCLFAGLLAGLLRGLSAERAVCFGAAAAAAACACAENVPVGLGALGCAGAADEAAVHLQWGSPHVECNAQASM